MADQNSNYHLQELSGSDFEIADGQPNIKGWDVKDENGKKIGEVDELLFDPQARKVRYIVLDLEGNVFDLEDRNVLVPIGIAQLHEKDDEVILAGVTADQLKALPVYDKDQLGPHVEHGVREVFTGFGGLGLAGAAIAGSGAVVNEDFYEHHHFDQDKFYENRNKVTDNSETIPVIEENLEIGKREVETGGVRLRSKIVEEAVSEDVKLREEKVTVERTPVDRPASASDLRENNIEMVEKAEVPVVNKEARVVEEVSLEKTVNEREETIRDTVKKTEIDIDRKAKDDDVVNNELL